MHHHHLFHHIVAAVAIAALGAIVATHAPGDNRRPMPAPSTLHLPARPIVTVGR